MKIFSTLSPERRRNLLTLFVAGLLFWSSLASLLPTLPLYLKDIGASNQQLGIVMGAFAIGLLLFRPWLGWVADRRGRKLVLLIGMSVAAIAPLGYLVTQSILPLIVVRIFHGVSIAAFSTAYSALVVDLSPSENRGEVIGYMSLVNPVGVALGPAIGGFLQAGVGYVPLFLMASGLSVVGLVCNLQIDVPPVQSDRRTPGRENAYWRLLVSPRIRIPTLTMLLIGLAFGTLSTFVPLLIQAARISLNPGLFYTAAAIASFGVRIFAGRASDRYGRGRFISMGLLCYATAMFILWAAHQPVMFLLAGVMEGTGAGIFLPMIIALVADRSAAHERGQVLGLCMGGFDLGIAIAGPILGSVADQVGYRSLFGLAAGLALLACTLFVTLCSKDLPHSLRFSLSRGEDVYALPKPSGL